MKTHDEVMGLLPRYNTLSSGERADVDEHVTRCQICAARLAILQYIDRERAGSKDAPWHEAADEHFHPALSRPLLGLGMLAIAALVWLAARGDLMLLPRLDTLLHPAPPAVLTPAPTRPPPPTVTPEPTVETGAPPGSLDWLRAHAVTFRRAEPGGDLGDLGPLQQMIGQAQVVVVSDPTFGGTHETLAMRQRLLELLVEQMGFGVVLAEVPMATGEQIDTYIQGGAGEPENLLDTRTTQTQEWLYTVRWLRAHNASPSEKVHVSFAGFLPSSMPPGATGPDAVAAFTVSNLDRLLRDAPNERVVVWRTTADPMLASSGNNSYLRLRYGSRAVFVTFAFYRGSLYAYPSAFPDTDTPLVRAVHTLPAPPTGSYESWLHAAGMPRLLLDMRPGLDDASRLPALHYSRSLRGGVDDCYPEDNFVEGSLADDGDLLIFFDQVTPPTLLARAEHARPPACPASPQNLDFARGIDGWYTTDLREYEIGASGGEGYVTARAAEPGRLSSGVLGQSFRADEYRGKRVRFTVVAGTQAAVAASLWLEADLPAFKSQALVTQPLPGAFSQPYALDLYVPDDAIRISFGVQLHGQGKVTVRDVKLEVVK